MTVIEEIQTERAHQVAKGYTPEHDDEHGEGHLLEYLEALIDNPRRRSTREELVKAGAMIVALIEMRDREHPE